MIVELKSAGKIGSCDPPHPRFFSSGGQNVSGVNFLGVQKISGGLYSVVGDTYNKGT